MTASEWISSVNLVPDEPPCLVLPEIKDLQLDRYCYRPVLNDIFRCWSAGRSNVCSRRPRRLVLSDDR